MGLDFVVVERMRANREDCSGYDDSEDSDEERYYNCER